MKYFVQAIPPLDFYSRYTLTLQEWLAKRDEGDGWNRIEEFMRASVAVSKHPFWEWGKIYEPIVGYKPGSDDGGYFIFKIENNGTTFLVSQGSFVLSDNDNPAISTLEFTF